MFWQQFQFEMEGSIETIIFHSCIRCASIISLTIKLHGYETE